MRFAGHLNQILKQRDAPTDQRRDPPWHAVQMLEMAVPGKGHEQIGCRQHERADGNGMLSDDIHKYLFLNKYLYTAEMGAAADWKMFRNIFHGSVKFPPQNHSTFGTAFFRAQGFRT
jgi:hypothetical protein